MTTFRGPQSITVAPGYSKHRVGITAADADFTNKVLGINCAEHSVAHVQVIPTTGTVSVEVMWWSEVAGKFISENPARTKAVPAAGTPVEFDVDVGGRIMLVAITAIDAGSVDVYVSGHQVRP